MDRRLLAAVLSGSGPQRLFAYNGGTDPRLSGATFTRADASTCATYVDSAGVVQTVAANVPRYQHYVSGSGPTLLLEGSQKNLVLQTEDWSTTWAAVGTPTRVAASDTASGISLDTIGDDDALALEGYTQTVTFTGNAVKSVAIYVKKGTSTSSVIRLRDTTAGADRLLAAITWSGTVPVVTMTTGTALYTETLIGGVYRVILQTTSVTAANTNSLQFYPATDAALAVGGTGTILANGSMAVDAAFCGSYVKNVASLLTRAADSCSWPFLPVPQAMTVYAKGYDLGTLALNSGFATLWRIHNAANATPYLRCINNGGGFKFQHDQHNGSAVVASTPNLTDSYGDLLESRTLLNGDGSIQGGLSVNGGAETLGSASAANALAAAWSGQTLYVNTDPADATRIGFLALSSLKIAGQVRDLGTMRGL